ncbi:hypothetical protein K474DRAFT_1713363 [Panus rudis PR-1116 ss-1]|nr:hypothetical protein K474DRAFT_1713363 [Panus rudis PR-1116 ss-1]
MPSSDLDEAAELLHRLHASLPGGKDVSISATLNNLIQVANLNMGDSEHDETSDGDPEPELEDDTKLSLDINMFSDGPEVETGIVVGEKHPRANSATSDSLELDDQPSASKVRIKGKGKPLNRAQTDEALVVVRDMAADIYRAKMATEGAFPHPMEADSLVDSSWNRACRVLGVNHVIPPGIASAIHHQGTSYRSNLKSQARYAVAEAYHFRGGPGAKEHNEEHADLLLANNNLFTWKKNGTSSQGHGRPFTVIPPSPPSSIDAGLVARQQLAYVTKTCLASTCLTPQSRLHVPWCARPMLPPCKPS